MKSEIFDNHLRVTAKANSKEEAALISIYEKNKETFSIYRNDIITSISIPVPIDFVKKFNQKIYKEPDMMQIPTYKWIGFTECSDPKQKTKRFMIINKESGVELGLIKWYGPFRQYSWFPEPNRVFEKTCLIDIADFLTRLMDKRKGKKNG